MRDKDVRAAVRARLSTIYANDPDTRIVEEMGIWSGTVRIDVAVINGELAGYELKSDRDTLLRLPYQADLYSRVFDRVTLVAGSRHIEKAASKVPDWWGLLEATEKEGVVDLLERRSASPNPGIDPYLVAQLLWKQEAISVLEAFGLARGWRSKSVKAIHLRLAEVIPFLELACQVRATLRARTEWLRQDRADEFNMPIHSDLHPVL